MQGICTFELVHLFDFQSFTSTDPLLPLDLQPYQRSYLGHLRIGSRQATLHVELSLSRGSDSIWTYGSKLRSQLGDTDDRIQVSAAGKLISRQAQQYGAHIAVEYGDHHVIVNKGKDGVEEIQRFACESNIVADGPAEPHLLSLMYPLTVAGFRQNLLRFDTITLDCQPAILVNQGLEMAPFMGPEKVWHLDVFRESDTETPLITYYLAKDDPQLVIGIHDRSVGAPGDCLLVAIQGNPS